MCMADTDDSVMARREWTTVLKVPNCHPQKEPNSEHSMQL